MNFGLTYTYHICTYVVKKFVESVAFAIMARGETSGHRTCAALKETYVISLTGILTLFPEHVLVIMIHKFGSIIIKLCI